MASSPQNLGWNQVNTPVNKIAVKGNKIAGEIGKAVIPRTPLDVALTVFPYGRAARMVGGITGKGAAAVAKLYRNVGK